MTTFQERAIRLLKQILAGGGGGGGGATIAATSEILKGDGAGNGIAATPGTDFATVAQAAHSGGVIGTASWDASGASIASLVNDGVITGVIYTGVGDFALTLSGQADANYTVHVSSSRVGGNGVTGNYSSKLAGGFNAETYDPRTETMVDPASVTVTVMRLSQ